MGVLTDEERERALRGLNGWTYDPDRLAIKKRFEFKDFPEAFAFMTRVALEAEKADHHPYWVNCWNKVEIELMTHDADGVTGKDIALAHKMDGFSG